MMYTGKLVFAQVMEHLPLQPVAHRVRVGERIACDRRTNPEVVELCAGRVRLDVFLTNNFTLPAFTITELYMPLASLVILQVDKNVFLTLSDDLWPGWIV